MTDDSRIQIYQSPDGETRVDVRFEKETVWLRPSPYSLSAVNGP
ncbi:hypothetical protein [Desulfobacula sp.]